MRGDRLVCPRCGWDAGGFWALCQFGESVVLLPDLVLCSGSRLFASLQCPACFHDFEVPANRVPPLVVE